jgi:hypothetical protein
VTYIEYLKSIGHTDAEIATMTTAFGGAERLAKAFETPIRQMEEAQTARTAAENSRTEMETWYQNEIIPKISTVYQDAINTRTRNAALEERLKAAKEYGFLSDNQPVSAGTVPGVPAGQPVPGSPGPSGFPSSTAGPGAPPPLDSRYVSSEVFVREVNGVPAMLGRLTKMSNEHFSLFGSPLLDVDTLIDEAQKQKKNVVQIWEAKYKVPEKRLEIQTRIQQDHDRQVGEEAVRKYASEHGQPFLSPGRTSVATQFTRQSSDDARHPWKGAADRQRDRRNKLLTEFQKGSLPGPGPGSGGVRPN